MSRVGSGCDRHRRLTPAPGSESTPGLTSPQPCHRGLTPGYHTDLDGPSLPARCRWRCCCCSLPFAPAGTQPRAPASITSPTQQFGAAIGDDYFLATWRQFEDYWKKLDRESNRMALVDLGKTEEGRSQWMAIITAPENFQRLDRYKEISRRLARAEGLTDEEARSLAQEGRAIVWIDGGLHADEVLGAQQLIETVYQLVSANDAETQRFLRDVIVLAVHANPDGHALVGDWYMREPVPHAPDARAGCRGSTRSTRATTTTATSTCPRRPRRST